MSQSNGSSHSTNVAAKKRNRNVHGRGQVLKKSTSNKRKPRKNQMLEDSDFVFVDLSGVPKKQKSRAESISKSLIDWVTRPGLLKSPLSTRLLEIIEGGSFKGLAVFINKHAVHCFMSDKITYFGFLTVNLRLKQEQVRNTKLEFAKIIATILLGQKNFIVALADDEARSYASQLIRDVFMVLLGIVALVVVFWFMKR
jgi:hypothetical protein